MAKPNKIEHVEKFIELVWTEIQTRFGEYATPKDIVYHLIEKGVAEPTRLRNYLIIKEFDRLLIENEGHVTHTFMDLSIIYNLSDRQVQGVVYKYRNKFRKEQNIVIDKNKSERKSKNLRKKTKIK